MEHSREKENAEDEYTERRFGKVGPHLVLEVTAGRYDLMHTPSLSHDPIYSLPNSTQWVFPAENSMFPAESY
jgi:hypothetical protein